MALPSPSMPHGNVTEGQDHGLGDQKSMSSDPSSATHRLNGFEKLTLSPEPQFPHL